MRMLKLSTDLQSDLIKNLSSSSTLTDILNEVVSQAAEALEASACTIFIVDSDRQTATQRASIGYQEQYTNKVQCQIVPADQILENPKDNEKLGLTNWILSTGKSFLAETPEELVQHPHHSGKHDLEQLPDEELRLQTFLGVPLRGLHGEVIGLIKAERLADTDDRVEPFSVNDQIVLETLARVASKCCAYLGMVRIGRIEEAITAWTRDVIAEATTTEGELDSFLHIIVNVVPSAMHANSCGIYLIDESKKTLTQRAGVGSQAPRYVIRSYLLPKKEEIEESEKRIGLTAWIASTGKSFHARNFKELSSHPHHQGRYDGQNFPEETNTICGAFLGVPLQVGGTIIGVIKVENISRKGEPDTRDFSEEAQRRFDVLAQDIALSIMRIQEQSQARYQVINDAQPTIFEILRGGLDVPKLVEKVVKETANLFNARASALFLKEGDRLIQPPWAAYGWAGKGPEERGYKLVEREEIKKSPTSEEKVGLTVWIAVEREKFTAKSNLELTMHPHHKGTFDNLNFGPGEQCESFMGVPLLVEDRLIGVLKVETKMKPIESGVEDFTYFSEQDELVFDLIANSAAIAIENARLLESQRLAEQIRSQPQRLMIELHNFIKDHWNAVDVLKQTADLLRGGNPNIANIIDNYAALLQPEFSIQPLEAIIHLIAPMEEVLEYSRAFSILYRSFADAFKVESLANIAGCCTSDNLADARLLEPHFFLADAVKVLINMYRQITEYLQGEDRDFTRLQKVETYLKKAQESANAVCSPEREIIRLIIDQWLGIVRGAREEFREVENPYVAGKPIDPESGSLFFGRQDIFEWVSRNLQGIHQSNVLLLHGERRMGKTSILLQLERGKLGEPLRKRRNQPLVPVFIDLQSLAPDKTNRTGLFLYGIAKRISNSIGRSISQKEVTIPSIADFEKAPYMVFEEFMEEVSSLVSPAILVLMLDEFEALENFTANNKVDSDIYGHLRHQMQFLPNIAFILAGTHQLEELSDGYRGIVFNVALHQEVSFMDNEAARALVQQPVAEHVIYEDAAMDKLLLATHGHPYLLQLLCQRLIYEMNRRAESNFISLGDVNAAIKHFVDQLGEHLINIWDQSTPVDKAVLAALSETMEAGQFSNKTQSELVDRLPYSPYEIEEVLHRLIRRGLVEEAGKQGNGVSETQYRHAMGLFCQWIHRHFPLDILI